MICDDCGAWFPEDCRCGKAIVTVSTERRDLAESGSLSSDWLASLRSAVAEQRAARAAYDARDKSAIVGSMLEMALLYKLDEATRAVARAAEGMVDAANA